MEHNKLEYRFFEDTLFKMLFVRYPMLLEEFIALILNLQHESITDLQIMNPEIPPSGLGEKFCRLDIYMKVNGKRVILEIQIANKGDFPVRSLYYWAREFSSALISGQAYSELPQVIYIGILDFNLFKGDYFLKIFHTVEDSTHEILSDKEVFIFAETHKLPKLDSIDNNDVLKLFLSLFLAKTEDDLKAIQTKGVPIVNEMIDAYREITVQSEFIELARMRRNASNEEASAIKHAVDAEKLRWQSIVTNKDNALADKDNALADKDKEIARLRTLLKGNHGDL
jgi:predicted transposase/invertase (TIGR01784 family)